LFCFCLLSLPLVTLITQLLFSLALIDTVYKDAIVYVPFDNFDATVGIKNQMQLQTTSNDIRFTSGPVNTALCALGNSPLTVGTLTSDCLANFGAGCDTGYVLSFWLYVLNHKVDQTIEILKFHDFSVEVEFTTGYALNTTFNFKMSNCITLNRIIGIETYHQYTVLVRANREKFLLYIDGEFIEEGTCTGGPTGLVTQELVIGGASRICIDDFSISKNEGENYPQKFYTDLVKGNLLFFIQLHSIYKRPWKLKSLL